MRNILGVFFLLLLTVAPVKSQQQVPKDATAAPASTQWLLKAATPAQRTSINSVYEIICPLTNRKGTAFLLSTGIMVTDEHVVSGCGASNLIGISPVAIHITFSKMITDARRDLALLKPTNHIDGGLTLGDDLTLTPGNPVSTWGYPLTYDEPFPILSVGYFSGFATVEGTEVKHLVVNGAFNPGNSGGPLLATVKTGRPVVVGVVVWRMRVAAPVTGQLIDALSKSNAGFTTGLSIRKADGTQKGLMQNEVISLILQEFYNTVQVMIGEATSVTELKAFMKEKATDLN